LESIALAALCRQDLALQRSNLLVNFAGTQLSALNKLINRGVLRWANIDAVL
jgi:hypothetical protein